MLSSTTLTGRAISSRNARKCAAVSSLWAPLNSLLQIVAAELTRVNQPRETVGWTEPDQVGHSELDQKADVGHDISTRLAVAEAARDAEREKNALLQCHLDDVRLMLPAPDAAKPRRRWWPW
jgi:hypothetical protein